MLGFAGVWCGSEDRDRIVVANRVPTIVTHPLYGGTRTMLGIINGFVLEPVV